MKPLNISGVGKNLKDVSAAEGIYITLAISYKTSYVVNGQKVVVLFDLAEGLECNTI